MLVTGSLEVPFGEYGENVEIIYVAEICVGDRETPGLATVESWKSMENLFDYEAKEIEEYILDELAEDYRW